MTRQTRTREDPVVRRAQILDETLRIIGELGFHGFTVKQLSARCGMSNAGLLHYFASKDALLAAVLEEIEARQIRALSPLLQTMEAAIGRGTSTLCDVRVFLRAILEQSARDTALGPFLFVIQAESIDRNHAAHAYFQRAEAGAIALYERVLEPHVAHPGPLARTIHGLMIGLGQQWFRTDCQIDVLAIWDAAMDLLLIDERP